MGVILQWYASKAGELTTKGRLATLGLVGMTDSGKDLLSGVWGRS